MDSKELRNLHEAYMDVYAPQENIEEGLRSAVKRLLGGGKKEAESSKPESRGEQLRKKYNVGPEKSDTSAKRKILDRSRAKAEKDEKDYGDKPFQKQVANQSKAAHDRYLKAGYSKYGADDARGRGSKAAKRAESLNKEQVDLYDIILSHLLDEGYASTEESADKIILNMSESWFEEILEARASEKRGLGSPESPLSYPGRETQQTRGQMGGRHYQSGGEGGSKTERGRKKSDKYSQSQRLRGLSTYPEKPGKYAEMQRKRRGGDIGSRYD